MSIIAWIVVGAIAGWVASKVVPGDEGYGVLGGLIAGIVGALLGGWLGRAIGWYGPNEAAGFVMALIGALILLGLYRLLVARRA